MEQKAGNQQSAAGNQHSQGSAKQAKNGEGYPSGKSNGYAGQKDGVKMKPSERIEEISKENPGIASVGAIMKYLDEQFNQAAYPLPTNLVDLIREIEYQRGQSFNHGYLSAKREMKAAFDKHSAQIQHTVDVAWLRTKIFGPETEERP